jgi:integrase
MTSDVIIYEPRPSINGKRPRYTEINRKKIYPYPSTFTLAWGKPRKTKIVKGSMEQAILEAKKKEVELMSAPKLPPVVEVKEPRLQLGDAAQVYLARAGKNTPRSVGPYTTGVTNFLDGCDKKYLDQIGLSDLEEYRDDMLDEYSGGTVKCRLDYVCNFINSFDTQKYPNLMMWHKKKEKRVPLTLRYDADKPDVVAYTRKQYDALYAASTPEEQVRWATLRSVGYRKNEQAHATYSDIQGRSISIRPKPEYDWEPKSKAGTRLVTVPASLLALLEQRRLENPGAKLIFPGDDGKPQTGSKLLYMLKVRAWKAGLNCCQCEGRRYDGKDVTCAEAPVCNVWKLHKFRSSFATDLYNARKPNGERAFSELQIMAFMGHSDFEITMRYLAVAKANDPEVCAAIDNVWAVDSAVAVGA